MVEREELKKLLIEWLTWCVFETCPMSNVDVKGLPKRIQNEFDMVEIIKEHF